MATGQDDSWSLENLATYKNQKWTEINVEKLTLKIVFDLLVILSNDTVLFKMKLNRKLKVCYKENTIVIAYTDKNELTKIKFTLNCAKGEQQSVINNLSIYTPIHNVNKSNEGEMQAEIANSGFGKLFQEELARQTNYSNIDSVFPAGFQLNEFLKLCIMDPAFPDMVDEVEKSLHKFLH